MRSNVLLKHIPVLSCHVANCQPYPFSQSLLQSQVLIEVFQKSAPSALALQNLDKLHLNGAVKAERTKVQILV